MSSLPPTKEKLGLLGFFKLSLITGFFSGYSPIAPGTAGTAAACVLVYFLPTESFLAWTIGLVIASTLISGFLGGFSYRVFGRKDPGHFTLDEFAGLFVTVLHPDKPDLLILVLAFFIFRVFDIVKPVPARNAESLPGGWGIVTDDLIAGIYANVLLLGLRLWVL